MNQAQAIRNEAKHDMRIEAQPETPQDFSDRICAECWSGNPQGNYSLKEVIENSAEELAESIIKAAKHDLALSKGIARRAENLCRQESQRWKHEKTFAVLVEIEGYSVGDISIDSPAWHKETAVGQVSIDNFRKRLRLDDIELDIDVPENLPGIAEKYAESMKEARIENLKKQLAEAEAA